MLIDLGTQLNTNFPEQLRPFWGNEVTRLFICQVWACGSTAICEARGDITSTTHLRACGPMALL
jgi:hypothetical protein